MGIFRKFPLEPLAKPLPCVLFLRVMSKGISLSSLTSFKELYFLSLFFSIAFSKLLM